MLRILPIREALVQHARVAHARRAATPPGFGVRAVLRRFWKGRGCLWFTLPEFLRDDLGSTALEANRDATRRASPTPTLPPL